MMDALARLFTSTVALYSRYGLDAQSTPPEQRRKFLMEEVGELVAASTIEVEYDFEQYTHRVSEEAADVLVTTLGLLQSHGITLADLEAACERVAAKNDAKTPENGYALVNGKISRKASAS